jgi:hypothetical protein
MFRAMFRESARTTGKQRACPALQAPWLVADAAMPIATAMTSRSQPTRTGETPQKEVTETGAIRQIGYETVNRQQKRGDQNEQEAMV